MPALTDKDGNYARCEKLARTAAAHSHAPERRADFTLSASSP
jgi:hypothetical protein